MAETCLDCLYHYKVTAVQFVWPTHSPFTGPVRIKLHYVKIHIHTQLKKLKEHVEF